MPIIGTHSATMLSPRSIEATSISANLPSSACDIRSKNDRHSVFGIVRSEDMPRLPFKATGDNVSGRELARRDALQHVGYGRGAETEPRRDAMAVDDFQGPRDPLCRFIHAHRSRRGDAKGVLGPVIVLESDVDVYDEIVVHE